MDQWKSCFLAEELRAHLLFSDRNQTVFLMAIINSSLMQKIDELFYDSNQKSRQKEKTFSFNSILSWNEPKKWPYLLAGKFNLFLETGQNDKIKQPFEISTFFTFKQVQKASKNSFT